MVVHGSCVLGSARHLSEVKSSTGVGSFRLIPVNGKNATEKVAYP